MNKTLPKYNETIDWLLQDTSPEIQYLTHTEILNVSPDDPSLKRLQQQTYQKGVIAEILAHMQPEGYWEKAGPGYLPKYRSTVWSILLLAQLGAKTQYDSRIKTACDYLCQNALTSQGQFTFNGAPSGTFDCLQGNLCWALSLLNFNHPLLDKSFEWMARTVTGEGLQANTEKQAQNRYYAYQCGPVFACGSNDTLSCAWGGIKVMKAFSLLPRNKCTPLIQQAIQTGIDFFFSVDPATASYPITDRATSPSRNWWKFGFPLFYVSDVLEIAEFMTALGYGADPRLMNLYNLILEKQNSQGGWNLEYDYKGKTWGDFGVKNKPNPWVTLRVLRVLKQTFG